MAQKGTDEKDGLISKKYSLPVNTVTNVGKVLKKQTRCNGAQTANHISSSQPPLNQEIIFQQVTISYEKPASDRQCWKYQQPEYAAWNDTALHGMSDTH